MGLYAPGSIPFVNPDEAVGAAMAGYQFQGDERAAVGRRDNAPVAPAPSYDDTASTRAPVGARIQAMGEQASERANLGERKIEAVSGPSVFTNVTIFLIVVAFTKLCCCNRRRNREE